MTKILKAQFAIPGGFPTQQEALAQASRNNLEHLLRIKNLGITDLEVKARRFASGVAAVGSLISPYVPYLGYPMQLPAAGYDLEDYKSGRDGWEHLAGDVSEPVLYGLVKATPTKVDDVVLKAYPWLRNIASGLGLLDDIASAAGKDIYHDKKTKYTKSKLIKRKK